MKKPLGRIPANATFTDKALECHPPSRKAAEGKELTKNNSVIDPSAREQRGKEGKQQ